eukprot:5400723-Amphidinium_carterae.1
MADIVASRGMFGRRGTRSRLPEDGSLQAHLDDVDERLQANMADIGFDFLDGVEEPSSSDLEEAMFGTRVTRTASVFGGPTIDSNGSVFTVDREIEDSLKLGFQASRRIGMLPWSIWVLRRT